MRDPAYLCTTLMSQAARTPVSHGMSPVSDCNGDSHNTWVRMAGANKLPTILRL